MNRRIETSRRFDREFKGLPADIKDLTRQKLALYFQDENHPSLRVKRMQRTAGIWEMSVTMNYRITFQLKPNIIFLRRIGTHDILRRP